jgi:hypothetical protein
MGRNEIKVLSQPKREEHIAACGLFCTNCSKFQRGRCQGCQTAPAFSRCSARACCAEKNITGCWECRDFAAPADYRTCPHLNNLIAKVFALIFRSDRPGSLALLRDHGREKFLEAKRASGKM